MRLRILRALAFLPDKLMIKIQYRIKLGRRLNLKDPKRYTEKLQWYKLYYKDPLMIKCVDKYDVRSFVEENGCAQILNLCYGVYNSFDEIEFSKLPNSFVMKDTLGGGGNGVIIVKDKSSLDMEKLRDTCNYWTSQKLVRDGGREWPYYKGKKHRIIVEKHIESNEVDGGLIDYKFFCFNGKVEYLYVIADRKLGEGAGFGILDNDFNKIDVIRCDEFPLTRDIKKPDAYEEMVEIAEKLSKTFPGVRVDLFYQDGKIYFGEMTFFDGSGYFRFNPDEFDFTLGEKFILPNKLN